MELKNVEKLPENVRAHVTDFVTRLLEACSGNILSVFAYGSVTGRDFNIKTSDINLAVVVKDISLQQLKPALKIVRSSVRKKIPAPLFVTPHYIEMSLDTFPMEFIGMKDTQCLLFGDDLLSNIEVKKEDIRRECEYQLKGKLLTIRQAYLEQGSNRKGLENVIKASFRALMPVFRNILRLKNEGTPPLGKEEILVELGREFDIDTKSLLEVLKDKKNDGRIGGKSSESFLNDFLIQLEKLSEIVDRM